MLKRIMLGILGLNQTKVSLDSTSFVAGILN